MIMFLQKGINNWLCIAKSRQKMYNKQQLCIIIKRRSKEFISLHFLL